MEQQQRQQRRRSLHRTHHSILQAIARLERQQQQQQWERRHHALIVHGGDRTMPPVDRQSWEHLVTFLDNLNVNNTPHEAVITTELELSGIRLSEPPDGCLNVLQSFFARSDTTLTKVNLDCCYFGSQEDASQLLSAFQTNRTVTDLSIHRMRNLDGAALGSSLSILMQNMPQLRRLDCSCCALRVEGVRAFQPVLQGHRNLKQLYLTNCNLRDEGIRLIADALAENTMMEALDVGYNLITSDGLDDITRMIESTQLKTIAFVGAGLFNDAYATHRFVSTLQHKKASVQELPGIRRCHFPGDSSSKTATVAIIMNSLARNKQLNYVNLLLAPPPLPQQQQQQPRNSGTMMLKISHKAITEFATIPSNAGASAIFKLFQSRPQLLEKRIKRPAPAAAPAAAAVAAVSQDCSTNDNAIQASSSSALAYSQPTKRRRLYKYKGV